MKKSGLLGLFLMLSAGAWACSPVWIPDHYSVEEGHVYYVEGRPETRRLITEADAGSFAFDLEKYQRSQFHAEDAHHVFYKGVVLEGLDPAKIRYSYVGYLADDRYVFFNGKLIEGADGASFKMMPLHMQDSGYAYFHVDGDRVYGGGEVLPGDAQTAYALGSGYYLDDEHVYYMGEVLEEALPDAFEMSGFFVVSNSFVFRQNQRIEMDAEGFEVLEEVYGEIFTSCDSPPYLGAVLRNKHAVYALTAEGDLVIFRGFFTHKRARRFLENMEKLF